jgi:hypothetical protein
MISAIVAMIRSCQPHGSDCHKKFCSVQFGANGEVLPDFRPVTPFVEAVDEQTVTVTAAHDYERNLYSQRISLRE